MKTIKFSDYARGRSISDIALSIGSPKQNCEAWIEFDMPVFVVLDGQGEITEVFRRETIFPGARRSTKRRQVKK